MQACPSSSRSTHEQLEQDGHGEHEIEGRHPVEQAEASIHTRLERGEPALHLLAQQFEILLGIFSQQFDILLRSDGALDRLSQGIGMGLGLGLGLGKPGLIEALCVFQGVEHGSPRWVSI